MQKLTAFFGEFEEVKESLFRAFRPPESPDESCRRREKDLSEKLKNTMNFIFWKHNPENNTKFLNSDLHFFNDKATQKFETAWLSEFNIGNIMYLRNINLNLFQPGSQLEFVGDSDFLVDLLLYLR